ncbi:MAG: hypothetical protein ACRCWJ_16405 [Casimicrobium sp.]
MPIERIADVGQFGVNKDQLPEELNLNEWSDSKNVRFRALYAERFGGESLAHGADTYPVHFLAPYATPTQLFTIQAGLQKVAAVQGLTRTNITRQTASVDVNYTGTADNRWTGGTLNGVLVLNNGVDDPQFWGGTGRLAALPGWPAGWKADFVRPFRNFLVAGGILRGGVKEPHTIAWSSAAPPGQIPSQWTPSPTNDARDTPFLAMSPDAIVDGFALNDIFVIYKERSMYGLQFVGGQDVFRTYQIDPSYGMLARGCAAQFPGGHVVLGNGDVYVHSGQAPQPILTNRMRKWLFGNLDAQFFQRSFVASNPELNEAWICFPEPGSSECSLALVWNWEGNTFSIRELRRARHAAPINLQGGSSDTWGTDTGTWGEDDTRWGSLSNSPAAPRLLIANDSGTVISDVGGTFETLPINAYMQRSGIVFGDPEGVKTVKRIYPRIEAGPSTMMKIRVGSQMERGGPISWGASSTIPARSYKYDCFATGRFLALEITFESPQSARMRSFDIEFEPRGRY